MASQLTPYRRALLGGFMCKRDWNQTTHTNGTQTVENTRAKSCAYPQGPPPPPPPHPSQSASRQSACERTLTGAAPTACGGTLHCREGSASQRRWPGGGGGWGSPAGGTGPANVDGWAVVFDCVGGQRLEAQLPLYAKRTSATADERNIPKP